MRRKTKLEQFHIDNSKWQAGLCSSESNYSLAEIEARSTLPGSVRNAFWENSMQIPDTQDRRWRALSKIRLLRYICTSKETAKCWCQHVWCRKNGYHHSTNSPCYMKCNGRRGRNRVPNNKTDLIAWILYEIICPDIQYVWPAWGLYCIRGLTKRDWSFLLEEPSWRWALLVLCC